jgi:hypothetical protein
LQIFSRDVDGQTFRMRYYTCSVKTSNRTCVGATWWPKAGDDKESEDLHSYHVIAYFPKLIGGGKGKEGNKLPRSARNAVEDGDTMFNDESAESR